MTLALANAKYNSVALIYQQLILSSASVNPSTPTGIVTLPCLPSLTLPPHEDDDEDLQQRFVGNGEASCIFQRGLEAKLPDDVNFIMRVAMVLYKRGSCAEHCCASD